VFFAESQDTSRRPRGLAAGLTAGLTAVLALVGVLAVAPSAGALELSYRILRNDDPIGRLRLQVTQQGDFVEARIVSKAVVDVPLAPDYRFEHQAREVWRDGRLESYISVTSDNGKAYTVMLRRRGDDRYLYRSGDETQVSNEIAPGSLWTSTMLDRSTYFDPITGAFMQVHMSDLGAQPRSVRGQPTPAHVFAMAGDSEAEMSYVNGTLVRLVSAQADGSRLVFELE
jgi:hypothetical protein